MEEKNDNENVHVCMGQLFVYHQHFSTYMKKGFQKFHELIVTLLRKTDKVDKVRSASYRIVTIYRI